MAQNHHFSENNLHTYLAIDLKSFYASSECADRHLDPLTTNLVVADSTRTEKTICLAVSPSLKAYGIPGRARLFEVVQRTAEVNAKRLLTYRRLIRNPAADFAGESFSAPALAQDPSLKLSYIVAPPRMQRYEDVSSGIVSIYLKYIDYSDIIVYSIDEIFADVTAYLSLYGMTAHELAMTMIREVLYTTGITATAGIGTNLYLAKTAMDIVAKHAVPDKDGVRIAELDEVSYRELLWLHRPLTDFWRVGRGYRKKLEANGLYTMGDIARCSVGHDPRTGKPSDYYTEDFLFKLFGVNAETLIDHAWGYEPCTVADVKNYKSENQSLSSGQVLKEPYDYEKTELIVKEMADLLALDLVAKDLVTNQVVLTIGYDRTSIRPKPGSSGYVYAATGAPYTGEITTDSYGRPTPKHAHGTENLPSCAESADGFTSSSEIILTAFLKLFHRIMDPDLFSRRITVVACRVKPRSEIRPVGNAYEQLDLFTDYTALEARQKEEKEKQEKERRLQLALLELKKRYGKNAVLKGMNLVDGGTTMERNSQIGGHKA